MLDGDEFDCRKHEQNGDCGRDHAVRKSREDYETAGEKSAEGERQRVRLARGNRHSQHIDGKRCMLDDGCCTFDADAKERAQGNLGEREDDRYDEYKSENSVLTDDERLCWPAPGGPAIHTTRLSRARSSRLKSWSRGKTLTSVGRVVFASETGLMMSAECSCGILAHKSRPSGLG